MCLLPLLASRSGTTAQRGVYACVVRSRVALPHPNGHAPWCCPGAGDERSGRAPAVLLQTAVDRVLPRRFLQDRRRGLWRACRLRTGESERAARPQRCPSHLGASAPATRNRGMHRLVTARMPSSGDGGVSRVHLSTWQRPVHANPGHVPWPQTRRQVVPVCQQVRDATGTSRWL